MLPSNTALQNFFNVTTIYQKVTDGGDNVGVDALISRTGIRDLLLKGTRTSDNLPSQYAAKAFFG